MQAKISSFFKPPPSSSSSSSLASESAPELLNPVVKDGDDELAIWEKTQHQFHNTYKRRRTPKPQSRSTMKVLNKKRSYAQLYLAFGQSDFNLRTCPTCGVQYAPGEEEDEKHHKTFHSAYINGIQFKGWRNERVVDVPCMEGARIVLVEDFDPPAHKNKVQEVIKMMEIELGGGWIFHKLCKVYLFISSQRVAGCLVAEPIQEAFKILSCSVDRRSHSATPKHSTSNPTTLQFGEIIFQREAAKRAPPASPLEVLPGNCNGAIICEEDAVPAVCGIRAIWVTRCNRRKRIASQLLDAARSSFCKGLALTKCHLAFSPPTSAGKALASSYFGTPSFLVYRTNSVNC